MAEQPRSTVTGAPDKAHGIRTFLIADVRGYTRFTVEHGDEMAARLAVKFATVTRETVSARGGEVIELRGDEALAVFSSARDALRTAVNLQGRFRHETETEAALPMNIGIGLDAGEAVPVEGGYRGGALNLAARLCSLAGPGEVLASEAVAHLARKVEGLEYGERGIVQLKGFADLVRVVEVTSSSASSEAPADMGAASGRAIDQQLPIGGFLGALPAGLIVARDEELERIVAAVDAVVGGSGRLILLAGEPGSGKTRVAQEATLEARDRGFLIAAGRCYEAEQTLPFYAFREALASLDAACPRTVRAELPRHWPDVQRLLPNQAASLPTSSEGQEEQQRLFWAVTGFIQAIAEIAPVAVLLDDLHWADGSSLKLLLHLAHHTLRSRVLLLGTYRDVEVGRQHPLERALLDLDREGLAERVAIRRLPEEGTAALMAASLGVERIPDELAGLVYRRTEGNPFFVQQVMRSLLERGDIYCEDGRWQRRNVREIEVPESIRSVIGQRLSRLSEPAQETLREASVLGQELLFDELLGMGERTEKELEAALDEAVAAGLIREAGKNGYAFGHALTQQALYAELSARRRRRLHLAAGDVLEKLPQQARERRAPEIAWHLVQGDAGERALPYCLLAGGQAEAMFAHNEAEWQYRTALELAREMGSADMERQALEGLGQVLLVLARHSEVLEVLEPLADMFRMVGDVDGEARTVARIALAYGQSQHSREGVARARPVLERLGDHVSLGVTELLISLSWLYLWVGNESQHLATAEQAVEMARAVGDDRLRAHAENLLGGSLVRAGRTDDAIEAYRRSQALGKVAGDPQIFARATNNLAGCYDDRGQYEEAREHYEQALAAARQAGLPQLIAIVAVDLGNHAFFRGDWDDAQRYFDDAAEISRSLVSTNTAGAATERVIIRVVRGEGETVVREMEEISSAARRTGDLMSFHSAERFLAWRDTVEGRPQQAILRLEALLRHPDLDPGGAEQTREFLARAYIDAGQLEPAVVLVVGGLERAPDTGWSRKAWTVVSARLAHAQGRWEESRSDFEKALSLWGQSSPYFRALILLDYGRMLSSAGESDEARRHLSEALATFQDLGAGLFISPTERALAELI